MPRKVKEFDNYAIHGVEDYSKLGSMNDNIKRYFEDYWFSTWASSFNVSDECLDSFRSTDLDEIGETIEANPHIQKFFTDDPPQLLSGKDYTLITSYRWPVCVGKGSFGVALLAIENDSKKLVVVKLILRQDARLIDLLTEYALQRSAWHTLKDGCSAPEIKGIMILKDEARLERDFFPYLLVQDFCGFTSGGVRSLTLKAALEEHSKNPMFTKTQWEDICLKLLRGVNQLQKQNIHHLDIHSENILLQMEGNGLKVFFIDFGLSMGSWSSGIEGIFKEPPFYSHGATHTAPELFTRSRPLKTSDFFSCAYLIEEIANEIGNTPLRQEMHKYRHTYIVPEERPGFEELYPMVRKHLHGFSPSVSNVASNSNRAVFVLCFGCLSPIFVLLVRSIYLS